MNTETDYYQTLGVLPDAEQIVITAAYRALASQYHPDRWQGDKGIATRKMAEINVAYSILGDPEKRKAYDSQRGQKHGAFDESDEASEKAFDEAISDFEGRWKTACDVFPDLADIRKNLSKTSHKLAFAFVVQLIERKQFAARHELATSMEHSFLERYFGTNQKILDYARKLIHWGHKDAIKRLNHLVDVLGSDIDAEPIIKKIEMEFALPERRNQRQREEAEKAKEQAAQARIAKTVEALRRQIIYQPISDDTFAYARLLGYEIDVTKGGFFSPDKFALRKGEGPVLYETNNRGAMCLWIKGHLT